jgi:hypothetical protein
MKGIKRIRELLFSWFFYLGDFLYKMRVAKFGSKSGEEFIT